MATNANEILDRLAALLADADDAPWTAGDGTIVITSPDGQVARCEFCDDAMMIAALRNAAPALIRLARASIATTKGEPISMPEWAAVCHEHSEAIKALGEVRL